MINDTHIDAPNEIHEIPFNRLNAIVGDPKTFAIRKTSTYKKNNSYDILLPAKMDELNALNKNNVYNLQVLPPGKKAIGARWVLKKKYLWNGKLERLKARLVVLGNHQRKEDYGQTFAPVTKYESLRILLSIEANRDFEFTHFDYSNAYQYGDLDEEVYIKPPKEFTPRKDEEGNELV